MTSGLALRYSLVILMFIWLLSGASCGGGDDDTTIAFSNDNSADNTFYTQGISFGRPLIDASGRVYDAVNPLSVIETHPLTGELLEGYPRPLRPGEPMHRLFPLLTDGSPDDPEDRKRIPRDAALVIHFTLPVDPGCMHLDAHACLTPESPIQVSTAEDEPLALQALVQENRVILNPVTKDATGFPRNPAADPEGAFKLVIRSEGMGQNPVRSMDGKLLAARADLLGSPLKSIRFIAGSAPHSFIHDGDNMVNGYLPDLSPPRIIREVSDEGIAGAGSGQFIIQDPSKNFVILANNGMGEWAGGLLTLRPGKADEEQVWVVYNTATAFHVAGGFSKLPVPGVDEYIVQRAEFYEPIPGFTDPATAIDPKNHPKDPFDPEDQKNWELYYFALFDEWNEVAKVWEPVTYDPGPNGTNPIDPNWRISFRFSEGMEPASFRPYETFYVSDGSTGPANPGFGRMNTGRVTASDQRRIISFEPVLEDRSAAGEDRLLGFGGHPKKLRLVLRVIPPAAILDWFYKSLGPPSNWPPEVVDDLNATGVLGVMSASGRPLGLPVQFHDIWSPYCVLYRDSPGRGPFPPAVDLKYAFKTARTSDPETGAFVHRFMGLPETAVGGVPPITGITYRDHEGKIYGPHIADAGLDANGFLTGHPVDFIELVFDDYNPPPPSSPFAPDPIFKLPFGVGTPITAEHGCRFQHVYRNGDCSPDILAFQDTVLDLIGLAWAPIGGWVTNGIIEKMSIAISNSDIVPDTRQQAGIPNNPNSGLKNIFANNYQNHEQVVVVGREVPGGPDVGVPYLIDYKNLFAPKNAGPKFNFYLPWPAFRNPGGPPGFGYDSTHSLLIEYRLDKNEKYPLPQNNGFAFHPGIISSMLPRFRVYSRGDGGTPGFGPVYAASYPERYPVAWGPLPSPGNYGDNSRYFMIFNYVKRVSRIESFFLGPDPGSGKEVDFLTPLIDPRFGHVPEGTGLHVAFQAAQDPGVPSGPLSPWVEPEDVERLNTGAFAAYDYLRFRAIFEADVVKGIVPAIEKVVIPYVVK
jgi:hypothetical protein